MLLILMKTAMHHVEIGF